jgi:hypothetical protein
MPRRRKLRVGDTSHLPGLVRGAALRPEAFARVPALFSRPLVPVVGGRTVSLRAARRAATRGRLACGRATSALAREAAASGALVLDLDSPVGDAVARALAAHDLDRWQLVFQGAAREPQAIAVEEELAAEGESCSIRVGPGLGEEVDVLDGPSLGLRESLLLIDPASRIWRTVSKLSAERPAAARLLLADVIVSRLAARAMDVAPALERLARSALAEVAGGP